VFGYGWSFGKRLKKMQLEMLGVEGGKKGVRAKKKKVVAGTP
jgi:hypothetical protein